jgi:small GTP-binding protein
MDRIKKKMCLLGDPGVGKTSLIRRFVVDKYDDKYISTLGTKVSKKDISISEPKPTILTMVIWDLAGQSEFHQVHLTAFANAAGALAVGDVTRKETLDNLGNWISKLYKVRKQIPVILLANKYDLMSESEVGKEYVESLASGMNARLFFTSALTGENVEEAFQILGKMSVGAIKPEVVKLTEGTTPEMSKESKGSPILEIEDKLIKRFCDIIGDTEHGMNIVRKQFSDAGIDFNDPTRESLQEIAIKLVDKLRSFKGDETARKARLDFARILKGE